jgi:hypothetical protein
LNAELPYIKVASVEDHGLTPFTRRILCVDLVSRFTGDESQANVAERVYKEDPTLREFLQSPVARHIRLHQHLLPLLQEYSVVDMQNFLSDPGDDLVAATLKLVQQMAAGGMQVANGVGDESVLTDCIKVLSDFHKTVQVKGTVVKKYLVRTNAEIPGHQRLTARDGKPSKIDNFKKYVEKYPYLFKETDDGNGYYKLDCDLTLIDTLLEKYGKDVMGEICEHPIVFDVANFCFDMPDQDCDDDNADNGAPMLTQMDADSAAGKCIEVVDLEALQTYIKTKDKRNTAVKAVANYIKKVGRDGSTDDRFPGKVCHEVAYIRKFGIPGRRYCVGPSLQTIGREARAVACSSTSLDCDFQASIPSVCKLLAHRYEIADDCRSLLLYVQHPQAWKSFISEYYEVNEDDAKKMILRTFFGGKPADGNPWLWGLLSDVIRIREKVLADAKFAYLGGMFCDRPNPLMSRFAYAVFSEEDALLEGLLERLFFTFQDAVVVSALMFDGLILACPNKEDMREDLVVCLSEFSQTAGIKAVIKQFALVADQ